MARGTTLYLRALPESLVREVKAIAARRGITLTALVTDALPDLVRVDLSIPEGGLDAFLRPAEMFRNLSRIHAQLLCHEGDLPHRQAGTLDVRLPSEAGGSELDERKLRIRHVRCTTMAPVRESHRVSQKPGPSSWMTRSLPALAAALLPSPPAVRSSHPDGASDRLLPGGGRPAVSPTAGGRRTRKGRLWRTGR